MKNRTEWNAAFRLGELAAHAYTAHTAEDSTRPLKHVEVLVSGANHFEATFRVQDSNGLYVISDILSSITEPVVHRVSYVVMGDGG